MTTSEPIAEDTKYDYFNYCVCFIDLLGQQEALRGHVALHEYYGSKFSRSRYSHRIPLTWLFSKQCIDNV